MFMLAAGLIMPPAGFGGKYYRDALGSFPGWIPLFVGAVPSAAIRLSTEEAQHLRPVIVQVGLRDLRGKVQAIGAGGTREIRFPDAVDGTERVLLVPAPIPVSRIESIVFASSDARRAFEVASADFANVPVDEFRRAVRKTAYTKASGEPWPPTVDVGVRDSPLRMPMAAGGVMAMLLHVANRGASAVHACRKAFDPDSDAETVPGDAVLDGLCTWMQSGAVRPALPDIATDREQLRNEARQRLFWEFVAKMLSVQRHEDERSEDFLLEYLGELRDAPDERFKASAAKLIATLESLGGLSGGSPSGLFERHRTPLARAMILFCLRSKCVDLFQFGELPLLEADWVAAAILFGSRDGWLGLPLELRNVPGSPKGALSGAVSHRMAQLSHRIGGTGLEFGPPPPRVQPLRELFGEDGEWGARERAAAFELSRRLKWSCIRTRVSLGRGEYRMTLSGGSMHIEVPGEPRVESIVDHESFYKFLGDTRVPSRAEAAARKKLS